jgi:hypothetical protein
MTKLIGKSIVDTETGEIIGKPITDSQTRVIKMIESNLHIEFSGKTYQDAWKFINENMEKSRQARPRHKSNYNQNVYRTNMESAIGLAEYFRGIENKYCDLFSDEDMEGYFM